MKYVAAFIIATAILPAFAHASVNLDLTYSCRVLQTNQQNVPVGSVLSGLSPKLSLRDLERGFFKLRSPTGEDVGAIDFYGPLELYYQYGDGSEKLSFSTDPTQPREVHGSISMMEIDSGEVQLDFLVLETTRSLRKSDGSMALIFAKPSITFKVSCIKK